MEWRNHPELNGGGVRIDGGIHKASILAYLTGRPCPIYASAVHSAKPVVAAEDSIVVITKPASGVVGIINHPCTLELYPKAVNIPGFQFLGPL